LPVYYSKPAPAAHDYVEMSAQPLYPFGYGLSYTTFKYSDPRQDSTCLSFKITNIGTMAGDEVVQLYVKNFGGSVVQPGLQLKAFKRITLQPGETRKVTFRLSEIDHVIVNDKMQWAVAGRTDYYIGSSSQNIRFKFLTEY